MDSSFVQAKRIDISTARMPFTVHPPQAQLLAEGWSNAEMERVETSCRVLVL